MNETLELQFPIEPIKLRCSLVADRRSYRRFIIESIRSVIACNFPLFISAIAIVKQIKSNRWNTHMIDAAACASSLIAEIDCRLQLQRH